MKFTTVSNLALASLAAAAPLWTRDGSPWCKALGALSVDADSAQRSGVDTETLEKVRQTIAALNTKCSKPVAKVNAAGVIAQPAPDFEPERRPFAMVNAPGVIARPALEGEPEHQPFAMVNAPGKNYVSADLEQRGEKATPRPRPREPTGEELKRLREVEWKIRYMADAVVAGGHERET